jgi:anti-sigma factor RsiW
MSNINRNNYEAFLLDYVEQNLTAELVAELMLFLEQNPDLKAELEAFENISFASEQLETFEHKADLKQAAVEELMIAELEGLNTAQETAQLNEAIKANEAYAVLFARYQKTILVPEQVVFSDKNSLKHKDTKVVPIYWWVSSAAAVLFVVFTLNPFVTDNNNLSSVDTRMLPVDNAQALIKEETKEVSQPLVYSSQH